MVDIDIPKIVMFKLEFYLFQGPSIFVEISSR